MAEDAAPEEEIPADWGWPKEPFQPEVLRAHVKEYTQLSQQELWDEHLEARAADSKLEDHVAERVFANVMLNKEGTGEERDDAFHRGIDPNAYKAGRWYRFLNAKGDCYVYVHNYTKDITATRPENFKDLTPEEKKRLEKLGTYIKELPDELQRVYDVEKKVPLVFASQETCEALKLFYHYTTYGQLLDVTKLRRVNAKGLEEARTAIVNAAKQGKTLCIYLGDDIPELREKICVPKNRDTFPVAVFVHDGLQNGTVREKIYREADMEGGQRVVRPGFRVFVLAMYDSMMFENSSMRKAELPGKIPDFEHMKEMRCYNDEDKTKVLEQLRAGSG